MPGVFTRHGLPCNHRGTGDTVTATFPLKKNRRIEKMTPPKPLGEKALQRMYKEAGLSEEKVDYLHRLFEGAANLYGVIMLSNLWHVYLTLTERKPLTIKIKKKELVAFSSIVRREEHDYFVFEIDELYSAEKRTELRRLLVINRLGAFNRYTPFYNVVKAQGNKPFYVPRDLTEVDGPIITKEEDELTAYLDNLVASSPVVYSTEGGKKVEMPSPHQGRKLSEFTFHDNAVKTMIEELESMLGNGSEESDKKIRVKLEYMNVPFSTSLMRRIRVMTFNSQNPSADLLMSFTNDLERAGVIVTDSVKKKLEKLFSAFVDNANLYINRGWTPKRLAQLEEGGIGSLL